MGGSADPIRPSSTPADGTELWPQLQRFTIDRDDAAVAFPFAARLARDNGWDEAFADRVVEEYRRFLFLGQLAGHPVTPSDEVDQAWHLHLTYTRSYWDDLCGRVLGRPFHHGPTEGGPAEGAKFDDWYGRTLDSYRRWFGAEPPADIWPPADIRFGEAPHYVRINTARRWVVPKPMAVARRARRIRGASTVALVALPALALTGCLVAQVDSGEDGLVTWPLIVVLLIGLLLAVRRMTRRGRRVSRRGRNRAAGWYGGDAAGCGFDGDSGCGGGGCGGGGCGGCGS